VAINATDTTVVTIAKTASTPRMNRTSELQLLPSRIAPDHRVLGFDVVWFMTPSS